jgi:hypothetical protein
MAGVTVMAVQKARVTVVAVGAMADVMAMAMETVAAKAMATVKEMAVVTNRGGFI